MSSSSSSSLSSSSSSSSSSISFNPPPPPPREPRHSIIQAFLAECVNVTENTFRPLDADAKVKTLVLSNAHTGGAIDKTDDSRYIVCRSATQHISLVPNKEDNSLRVLIHDVIRKIDLPTAGLTAIHNDIDLYTVISWCSLCLRVRDDAYNHHVLLKVFLEVEDRYAKACDAVNRKLHEKRSKVAASSEPVIATQVATSSSEPVIATQVATSSSEPVIATQVAASSSEPVIATQVAATSSEPVIATQVAATSSEPVMTTSSPQSDEVKRLKSTLAKTQRELEVTKANLEAMKEKRDAYASMYQILCHRNMLLQKKKKLMQKRRHDLKGRQDLQPDIQGLSESEDEDDMGVCGDSAGGLSSAKKPRVC